MVLGSVAGLAVFAFERLCLGNSVFYPNAMLPLQPRMVFVPDRLAGENVLNLIFNHCKAGKSAEGDTAHCWMLFLKEGYSFFPPLFFHPTFVKVVHFLPRHQASRRALPFEKTQRSVQEKKEEVG